MKKFLISFWIKTVYFYRSFRFLFHIGLGDHVWYCGDKHTALNGAYYDNDGDHCWKIISHQKHNPSGERVTRVVKTKKLTKVRTLSNYFHSFRSHYRWLKNSWFKIDLDKKLK